jgi:hypothetical protein
VISNALGGIFIVIAMAKRIGAVGAVICANLILSSCSSGPRAPEKGTPAFYWAAAGESYAAGNYLKTLENLERVAATDNEYTARAQPWLLVLSSGMAGGYMEIADYFESGARINKADPTVFRKQVSQCRGTAGQLSLIFADALLAFQKGKDDPVLMAFPFPNGSPGAVPVLTKVANGMLPQPGEIETGLKNGIVRAVLLNTCRAVGTPNNPAKAQELFKAGDVKVPRATFVLAMADALHNGAQLYGRNKLDDPAKLKIFCGRAQEAIKAIPSTKETKELETKIQNTLKKS